MTLLWSLRDTGMVWVVSMIVLEFYRQYLHNPVVHTFFQSQGIFLF